jgi:hypothetical protein
MDQATQFVQNNSSMIGTITFIVVLLLILYVVYTYLYPAEDPTYTRFLKGEADARKPVRMKNRNVPAIYTGGDFTFSFWMYIDDWDYKVSKHKLLFSIGPDTVSSKNINPLVGLLTPYKNNLLVRAHTVGKSGPTAPGSQLAVSGSATPDITIESSLQQLLNQQTSMTMFQDTVETPCDVKEVPLQRWVCITIVSSGRVLDVYMDGKLSRSCVLENVLKVPRGPLTLRLGEFGGRFSSIQMWSQQLTPDVIYGIYQMGPTQTQHDLFTEVAKYLNLNVSFTGSAPGQPVPRGGGSIFSELYNDAGAVYDDARQDASSAYQAGRYEMGYGPSSTASANQNLMARY